MTRPQLSRREMIAGSVGTGFALAVQPIAAATITTGADGLDAGAIQIPTATGPIPGYRAAPAKPKGKPPIVLVVQEIFGVHEHIKDVCRRVAKLGAVAVAPELFVRQGDVSKLADMKEIMSKVVSKVPDEQVLSDLDAAVAWAKTSGGGDTARLGITGFCWGGRIVWLYAAHNPALKAGGAWYGRLVGDKDAAHPRHPIDVAAALKAPVLGLYGRAGSGHPRRDRRGHAQGARDRRRRVQALADPGLPGRGPRLLRGLSPELPRGRRRGRLEAPGRVVREPRRARVAHAASSLAAATARFSSTASAASKRPPAVSGDGITQQRSPAAFAAIRPRSESSMTRQRSPGTPSRSTARRYGSGSGFARA
jgi:carboxymethylenebutenolidase